MRHRSLIFTSIILGYFFSAAVLQAAAVQKGPQDWRQRREEILALIEAEVMQKVESDLPAATLAEELHLPYPTPVPSKSIEEVFAEVRQLALDSAYGTRPAQNLADVVKEAERLYPLFKVGDQVTLRTTIPTSPSVSGVIYQISNIRVQLGHRWVLYRDLVEEHRIALDEQRTMARRKNYVAQQVRLANAASLEQQQQFLSQQLPVSMKQAGYVCIEPQHKNLFERTIWLEMEKYLQNALQEARTEAANRVRPTIEKRLFEENGFRYYKNRKEWRPGGAIQRLKSFFGD